MRSIAKRTCERALRHGGPAGLARFLTRGRSLVLAYHNIVPDGEDPWGEASLHLSQRAFAEQLDVLLESHQVVPLASVLEQPGVHERPRACITFDDAYGGAVTAGVQELMARRLPATVFVAPQFVGGKGFWWDALADPETGEIPTAMRRHALEACGGRDDAVRTWAASQGIALGVPPEHARAATEEQLADLDSRPGLTLGSHTWGHPNLVRVPVNDLEGELVRPLCWLGERYASTIPWLTYPYGFSTPDVERAARTVGYDAALRVTGGMMTPDRAPHYALPRVNVPAGLSTDGFALRASGLIGA